MSDNSDTTISSRSGADEPSQHSQSSPAALFDNLATEIIEKIFIYVAPIVYLPTDTKTATPYPTFRTSNHAFNATDPWILLMVCKRWNAIAIAKHSLWAKIHVKTPRSDERGRSVGEWPRWGCLQLNNCLDKSGAQPLDIYIDGDQYHATVISGILDVIMPHSERWRRAEFLFPVWPELLRKLNALTYRLPLLEDLNIGHVYDSLTCQAFHAAPKLSRLSIGFSSEIYILNVRRTLQIVPWKQILVLIFGADGFRHEEDLHEILGQLSASLESLTFSDSFRGNPQWPVLPSRRTTLTKLRRLCFLKNYTIIPNMLICPSLEELEINEGDENIVIVFLDYSSCSLKHIKLQHSMKTVLQHPSLSTLRSISLLTKRDSILELLNFDSHHLFPVLETVRIYLHVEGHNYGPQCLISQIEGLQKFVDSRTNSMPLNQPEHFVNTLKNCAFFFKLYIDTQKGEDHWDVDEQRLQALQTFCVSRNICVLVDFSYIWDYLILTSFSLFPFRVRMGSL